MVNMKNTLKEEKMEVKRQLEEKEERHKRMKEKLKLTKTQLDQCLKLQRTQENEVDVARQKIEVRYLENIDFPKETAKIDQ